MQTHEIYQERVNRVIDHIQGHLDEALPLPDLAKIAAFSPFHFHRIFRAITGEGLNQFTERVRLEKAVRLLTREPRSSITDIAYDCGFSSSSVLSRSIRKAYDATPREIRTGGKEKIRKKCKVFADEPIYIQAMRATPIDPNKYPVRVESLPEKKLAYVRIINSYVGTRSLDGFRRLMGWAEKNGHLKSKPLIIGMSIDDPEATPMENCRYDACIEVPAGTRPDGEIGIWDMPAHKFAAVKVSGDAWETSRAIHHIYKNWLPSSSFEPEDLPCMEVFLDQEKVLDWSHFTLDIRVPIKSLRSR